MPGTVIAIDLILCCSHIRCEPELSYFCRELAVQKIVKNLSRPALHAKTLGFVHPATQEHLRFTTELPDDLAGTLNELRTLQ